MDYDLNSEFFQFIGQVTDLTAEEAVGALERFRYSLGQPSVRRFALELDAIGSHGASTESEVLNMAAVIGRWTRSESKVLVLAGALAALGLQPSGLVELLDELGEAADRASSFMAFEELDELLGITKVPPPPTG